MQRTGERRFYKMEFRTYECGDEGDCQFHLFNKSTLYALDNQVYSMIDNGQVIAFIAFFFSDNNQMLFVTAFETICKGTGMGRKVISYLQNCEVIYTVIVNPLPQSIPFWSKMEFEPNGDDWIWS